MEEGSAQEDLISEVEAVLRELTKECLRAQPKDIPRFCRGFLAPGSSGSKPDPIRPGLTQRPDDWLEFSTELEQILKDLTKECLLEKPRDVRSFCCTYFGRRIGDE
uniref:RIIa domain-containing protein n=1 Tax=Rhodosorus marinus TaxID=101924 RepID=A0A7S0BJV1_9RHOD|mmetsp:Transcript_19667/g.28620  ORF Transcript_19667/g.28620 Transcript_19667/m.28620 type:complete len:106 (+) Transcript_19667:93-410(+)